MSDTQVHVIDDMICQLWRVRGVPNKWYPNKEMAERAARQAFPSENADRRYARVSYAVFVREA